LASVTTWSNCSSSDRSVIVRPRAGSTLIVARRCSAAMIAHRETGAAQNRGRHSRTRFLLAPRPLELEDLVRRTVASPV
jgi:hypothetical protein